MSFAFILHESSLQQLCFASFLSAVSVAAVVVAPSALIVWHESPLQQQHDSIAQQASAFFFWSPCAGVCGSWAMAAANAISSKPSSIIRMVCFRGFILVLLYRKI